ARDALGRRATARRDRACARKRASTGTRGRANGQPRLRHSRQYSRSVSRHGESRHNSRHRHSRSRHRTRNRSSDRDLRRHDTSRMTSLMTTLWRKAIRDFWQERARTALVVLAIALGISAFAAVLSSYAILTRELDRGYLATNPASAVFRVDSIDDELVKAILQNPEVSDAEPRRTISGQIKAGPVQWRNLILFVVEDYGNIRVSKLVPESGAWPPATGEILIERDAFQVVKANIRDAVTIKTVNGIEQPLVVSGSVHDVGQAQARMENIVYGYINLATLVQLGEQPKLDQLNILVAQNKFDENHIRRVVADVEQLIKSRGHEVWRIDIPTPGKHPHSDLTGILLLAMSSFGLFVLVLSGILVINLLTAMM